jgi:uncharacterized protein YegL
MTFAHITYETRTRALPIALVLDTSGSMSGPPIEELKQALNDLGIFFKNETGQGRIAADLAEFLIITVGGKVEVQGTWWRKNDAPYYELVADGDTKLGEGISLASNKIKERITHYETFGTRLYRPILIVISDGIATDGSLFPSTKIRELVLNSIEKKDFDIIPLATSGADKIAYEAMVYRKPIDCSKYNFGEIISLVTRVVTRSASNPSASPYEIAEQELQKLPPPKQSSSP